MKLSEFLKELFNQECVDGYEIGQLEVYVDFNGEMRIPEEAVAKIVITQKEREND
ncbi:hypothetical protein LCGC14_1889110 [marine sediment metagenome]|uniref:Uncharacterized protein n=1 Tax=marine sediment metagenome TaxID=412755 RepID=A0A0F9IY70_9ZZZZ